MPPPTLNSEEPLMHLLVLGAFWLVYEEAEIIEEERS